MHFTTEAYEEIVARFTAWAQAEDNVRAAFVIGSRARTDHPADDWSDLDVIILARDPQRYLTDIDWIRTIGDPWITFLEMTPDGQGFEHRVLFAGGLDVDFIPESNERFRAYLRDGFSDLDAGLLLRGIRLLVDKDNLAPALHAARPSPTATPHPHPDAFAFRNAVNDFWYHTVWTAKKLRRGELWVAKSCCDGYLKNLLLRILEWHAQATLPATETWMRGRFLEEWADPRALAEMKEIFAHYDKDDVWRALEATMHLFRWLAQETAAHLGYPYPATADRRAADIVHALDHRQTPHPQDNPTEAL